MVPLLEWAVSGTLRVVAALLKIVIATGEQCAVPNLRRAHLHRRGERPRRGKPAKAKVPGTGERVQLLRLPVSCVTNREVDVRLLIEPQNSSD